jgi:hypothetical protein
VSPRELPDWYADAEPTTKAVHVDAEADEYVPEFTGAPPGTTMPRHADDAERAGYEAQLYVFLVDRGFESEGLDDCVVRDVWTSPSSPHSGRRGAELAVLLGFDPECAFGLLQKAREPKPLPKITDLLRRASGE